MQTLYNILLGLALFVAALFTALCYITSKGDAMSGGGGGIRTTFKGKAGFDDFMSRWTLIMGASFMALMIILDVISAQIARHGRT